MKITLNAAICICAVTLLSCQTGNESLCTVQATMPVNAESYDYKNINNVDDDYTYCWHFRLITYDIPANPCTMSINYSY